MGIPGPFPTVLHPTRSAASFCAAPAVMQRHHAATYLVDPGFSVLCPPHLSAHPTTLSTPPPTPSPQACGAVVSTVDTHFKISRTTLTRFACGWEGTDARDEGKVGREERRCQQSGWADVQAIPFRTGGTRMHALILDELTLPKHDEPSEQTSPYKASSTQPLPRAGNFASPRRSS